MPYIFRRRSRSKFPPPAAPGGGAGGPITPLGRINFDGLSNGAGVVSTGVTGKRFTTCLGPSSGFANGFGMQAVTSLKRPGKSSSCALSIRAGSAGDDALGDGAFGGFWDLPSQDYVSEGEEFWWGEWIYLPVGWRWDSQDGNNQIKFMRIDHEVNSGARLDIYVLNGNYVYDNGETSPATAAQQGGWAFRNEDNTLDNIDTDSTTGCPLLLGQWNWAEQYVYAHSNPLLAKRIIWINDKFAKGHTGNVATWYDKDMVLRTRTMAAGCRTLASAIDRIVEVFPFTYWNGNAAQNQVLNLQDEAYEKRPLILTATDEFGNKMMGSGAIA